MFESFSRPSPKVRSSPFPSFLGTSFFLTLFFNLFFFSTRSLVDFSPSAFPLTAFRRPPPFFGVFYTSLLSFPRETFEILPSLNHFTRGFSPPMCGGAIQVPCPFRFIPPLLALDPEVFAIYWSGHQSILHKAGVTDVWLPFFLVGLLVLLPQAAAYVFSPQP